MKTITDISRALIKIAEYDFQSTIKNTSKSQSKIPDSSTKIDKGIEPIKPLKNDIYDVENPVSQLIPGGINVY